MGTVPVNKFLSLSSKPTLLYCFVIEAQGCSKQHSFCQVLIFRLCQQWVLEGGCKARGGRGPLSGLFPAPVRSTELMLPHQGRAFPSSSSSQIQVAVSATLAELVALCPLPSAFWGPLLRDLSLIPMGSSSKF